MKKLLLSVLAISVLVACSKSDVIEMPQSQAIKFGSAFVDNSTKAIDPTWNHNNDTASFRVWGNLKPNNVGSVTTNIFNGVKVKKVWAAADGASVGTNSTWFYDDDYVQYWIPTVNYKFTAISGAINGAVGMADNLPSTIPYNAETQSDLLLATASATGAATGSNNPISFTFDHLLSKVQFEFVNAYPAASDLYIKVTNVQIVNPYETATYTISGSTWGSQTLGTGYTQSFGNVSGTDVASAPAEYIAPNNGSKVSNYARLMIPGTYKIDNDGSTTDYPLQISFVAQVYLKQGDTYTEITALKIDKSTNYVVPTTLTLQNNYSYNFKITLGGDLDKIMFSVSGVKSFNGEGTGESLHETTIPLS